MEVGSAYNYEQLLDSVKQQALDKIGGDKLQKISGLLGTAGLINAELSQFGFYKKIGNMFKETANEAFAQVNKPTVPLGTEGTGLKEFSKIETESSPQVKEVSKGVFGREILGDKPVATQAPQAEVPAPRATPQQPRQPLFPEEPTSTDFDDPLRRTALQSEIEPAPQQPSTRPVEGNVEDVENVTNRPVVPTEVESNFSDFLSGARANLSADVVGMTQKVRGTLFGRASQIYDKAVSYKQSLESGIDRISTLRNQSREFAQQLKSQAGDIQSQGRSLIQQGQEALARGETAGQDLVNQGQGLLNKALEQSTNSELFQTAMETAQSKISQGQQLLNSGKQEGMKLLQEGQEQLEQAQSAIKGYGGQARQFGQQIQTEIEGRTQQLNDLAENLMSQAKSGLQTLSDVGTAIKTGDVQGAVEGLQTGVKTAGQLAEKAGITGGEELGATLSEAIPVVGEIASAGLLIASLFTGFAPHESSAPIQTVTQAFGV
jgi:phage shock protein A